MKIIFLDTVTMGSDMVPDVVEKMYEPLGNLILCENTAEKDIPALISDADIIITNKCRLNSQTLEKANNLKLICVCATGYDNIDIEYCREKGIAVSNVRAYCTDSVAQVCVAMALSLVCHLRSYNSYVFNGSYVSSGRANYLMPVYHEISSLRWGIVGMGEIGRRTAKAAQALGAEVVTYTRGSSAGYAKIGIDELCKTCDIISLHLPLTSETRHLINADRIGKMKKSAVLINAARGAIVDEAAVANAIIRGNLGGLGVDVYDGEPISRTSPYNDLYGMTNVILTPHMAWGAYESRVRCLEAIRDTIVKFTNGEDFDKIV